MPFQPSPDAPPGERWSIYRLGLASALIYLLAFTLPYWLPRYYLQVKDEIYQFAAREPWRGVLFYAALGLLFLIYLAAYRLVAHADRPAIGTGAIVVWAAVFCLLLIPVYPLTSSDVYGYTFQGRIVAVLGENPFVHLYRDFAGDPFYLCVTFQNLPASTGYGPLWIAIAGAVGWLAREQLLLNLLLFKGLAAGLHLLSSVLVYATLRRVAPEKCLAGMLFYAWNPLLLYELVGNAHNDSIVVILVLLGFFLLNRKRGLWAIPCLAAAALVKPVALLWLPLAAVWLLAQSPGWSGRLRRVAAIGALAILPAVLAYLPFWAGLDTFQGLQAQSDIHGNSLPNLLIQGLVAAWPGAGMGAVQGIKLLTVLIFAPFYGWQLWVVWRAVRASGPVEGTGEGAGWGGLMGASFDVMLFYLLFVGFQFWPWYLAWLLVPAALLDEPPFGPRRLLGIFLCILSLLLYFPYGWQWARDSLPAWGTALLAALPMLALCLWLGLRLFWTRQSR